MHATRIVLGDVVTMDPARPRAEAIALAGDRILAVGDRDAVMRSRGPATTLQDLAGQTIMPGFVEAHGHPLWSALVWGEPVIDIRAEHTPTYAAVMAKIGRRVAKAGPGEFLMAVGLDPTLHVGMQEPTVDELDALAPGNPLAVVLFNFHGVYANTAAVRACGLDGALDPHVAAQIRRDDAGRPWKFTEDAGELVRNAFFERCGKERALREAGDWAAKFARAGYTTASEMGTLQEWQGYIPALLRANALPIRIRAYERAIKDRPFWSRAGEGDDRYALIGMKIWADGSLFVGNVGLSRPYLNTDVTIRRMGMPRDNPGHMNYSRADLAAMIEAAAARGFQLSVHTQGDATVDTVLDCYADVLARFPDAARPFRLEHCTAMREDQVARAHAMGVVCSFFNTLAYFWGDTLRNEMLGQERGDAVLPSGTAARLGMRASYHCDSPMTWPDALLCVQFGVTRQTRLGTVLGPAQRVDVADALKAVTIDAAYQLRMDDRIGSLVPGKLADLVALGANPLTTDPARLASIPVLGTWLGGEPVDAPAGTGAA